MGEDSRRVAGSEIGSAQALAGREKLRQNSEAVLANPGIIAALEAMLSARLGLRARHVRGEVVPRKNAYLPRMERQLRGYTRHWFEVSGTIDPARGLATDSDGLLAVFVKSALNLQVRAELETLLSDRRDKGFRVPYFFGCSEESGLQIGAWEFVPTGRVPIEEQPWEGQVRLVQAIARLNALPVGEVAPPLGAWKSPSAWFARGFERLDEAERDRWAALQARAAEVVKRQDEFFERVRSRGATFLTHNDIGVANLIVPPEGDIVFFDWESATLGVAGADLKSIDRAEGKPRLLRIYVEQMGELGHRLDLEDVRFVADVSYGYWLLRHGWVRHKRPNVERALDLIEAHLDPGTARGPAKPAAVTGVTKQELAVPGYIEKLVALAQGGPKRVKPELHERVKALQQQSDALLEAENHVEALPLLTELAQLTARPGVLHRVAKSLRKLRRREEASRLKEALRAAKESTGAGTSPAAKAAVQSAASQFANYVERYGDARCDRLLRLDETNESMIMSGRVPGYFERVLPLVPGSRVLEVGAGEGIMALALAAQKERVIGVDMTPVRHEKAKEIQAAWRKLGRDVDRCEFVLGDIFEKRELFRGMDTLLACHVIYYFRDRLDEFMGLVRDNMKYVCLIGNANRARHYKAGDHSRLAGFEYYSTVEGMKDILQRYGFAITYESEERTPIVVGEVR